MTAAVVKETTLNSLIREVIDENPLADPWDLAVMVARRTLSEELEGFYTEALVPLIRISLSGRRNSAINANRGGRTVSKKAGRVRDAWQQELDSLIAVGGGVYKPLRDCTAADLAVVIESRVSHIRSVQMQVDHFEALAKALAEQGVETVGELSGPVQ